MFQIDSENKLSTDEEGLDGSWMRFGTKAKRGTHFCHAEP